MRFAELCAATDVPSATVKYYLREGLLPAGERVSATRAQYGPEHVERLRLIRALVDGAQLSIDGVRRIDRHVCPAGLQGAEQSDEHLKRALDADPDQHAWSHSQTHQMVRELI